MVTGSAASCTLQKHDNIIVLLSVGFGTAMGVFLGALISISVSGAHLNPIVTISLAIIGKFEFRKIGIYVTAQYLGSFCATTLVFFNYRNAIDVFDEGIRLGFGGSTSTGQIFTTFPIESASLPGILLDQVNY